MEAPAAGLPGIDYAADPVFLDVPLNRQRIRFGSGGIDDGPVVEEAVVLVERAERDARDGLGAGGADPGAFLVFTFADGTDGHSIVLSAIAFS